MQQQRYLALKAPNPEVNPCQSSEPPHVTGSTSSNRCRTMHHRQQLANGLLSGAWTIVKSIFDNEPEAFVRWDGSVFPFVLLEQPSQSMFFKAWLQEAVAVSLPTLREVSEQLPDMFGFLGGATGRFWNPLAPPVEESTNNFRLNCAATADGFVASVIYNRIIGILAFEQRLASCYARLHKAHGWNLL